MHFPVLSCFLLGETRMQVLLPYVCGIAVLCIGLWYARKHLGPRLGVEALTSLGPIFYALPLAAFGADHFVFRDSIVQIVPSYMPAPMFWVYLVGAGLIAAALAIAVQQQVEPAALSLTAMFAIFELTVHIPNLFREPSSRFIWAVAARDLAFLGGALSLAITQSVAWPRNRIRILTHRSSILHRHSRHFLWGRANSAPAECPCGTAGGNHAGVDAWSCIVGVRDRRGICAGRSLYGV